MASNFVELKIKLDEQDLADQLLRSFASSPELAAQLSGALAPFVETILNAEGGVEGLNRKLEQTISLSSDIQQQMRLLNGETVQSLAEEGKELDRINAIREEANQLIQIQKAEIGQSAEAFQVLINLQSKLNDVVEREIGSQEELARISEIIRKVKQTTAGAEKKDIQTLISLSQTQTDQAKEALSILIRLRGQLRKEITDGNLSETRQRVAIEQLRKVEIATTEKRQAQIMGTTDLIKDEINAVKELGQLQIGQNKLAAEATARLRAKRAVLLEILERENTTRESAIRLTRILAEVESQLRKAPKSKVQVSDFDSQIDSAKQLIQIEKSRTSASLEAAEDLSILNERLKELIEEQALGQEDLAKASKIVSDIRSTSNKRESDEIKELIALSQSNTSQSQDALDSLIEKRDELALLIEAGIDDDEERLNVLNQLRTLQKATSEEKRIQIRAELDERTKERNEVRDLGILSKINNERGREAVTELVKKRKQFLALLEDENTTREEALLLAERLADVEGALSRNVGSGRTALRRQRSADGPDTFGTLLNLERIVQDIPFGLVGIANNLGPFLDQFTFFIGQIDDAPNKLAKLTRGFKLLGRALIFTPIGWITLLNVVTSLIIGGEGFKRFLIGVGDFLGIADKRANDLASNLKKLTDENFSFDIGADDLDSELESLGSTLDVLNKKLEMNQDIIKQSVNPFDTLSARILDFFNVDTDSFLFSGIASAGVIELSREVEKLDEQLLKLQKQAQETEAVVAADIQTILFGGDVSKLSESLEKQEDEKRSSLLKQLEIIGQFGEESVQIAEEIARAESGVREKQLNDEVARLERLRQEIVAQSLIAGDEVSDAQRALIATRIKAVEDLIAGTFVELSRLEAETDAKIKAAREKLNKEAEKNRRERERRLDEIRKAADQIFDLDLAIQRGLAESTERGLELRLRIVELETVQKKRQLEEQLRDFKGTERQKVEFAKLTSRRIEVLDSELAVTRRDIARESARDIQTENLNLLELQMKIAETSVETQQSLNTKIEAEQRRHSGIKLEIERELLELSLKDQTELVKKRIDLLLDLLNAEKELSQQRVDFIIDAEKRRVESALSDLRFDTQNAIFDAEEALRFSGETQFAQQRRLMRLRQERRELEEIGRFEAEQERIKEEFDEKDQDALLEELERQHQARMLAIQRQGANERSDARKAEFDEIVSSSLGFFAQQANIISQISDTEAQISENKRRNELVQQGKSEEEINKIIEKESAKRLKAKKAAAKISIIASTAVAAVEAFRGVMEIPFLPPAVSLPLAFAAAGTAIAFGVSQIRAVDSERLSASSGSGVSSVAVGEITPPGLEDQNPLVEGFQAPFGVVEGPAGLGGGVAASSAAAEVRALRADIREMNAINEGRPVLADVPEENARRIALSGKRFDKKISRP